MRRPSSSRRDRGSQRLSLEKRVVFFFQGEGGIRNLTVTGVQTCALPISLCVRSNTRKPIRHSVLDDGALVLLGADIGRVRKRQIAGELLADSHAGCGIGVWVEHRDRKSVV